MTQRGGWLLLLLAVATASSAQDLRKVVSITTPSRIGRISVCGSTGLAAGLGDGGSVHVWRMPWGEAVTTRPAEDGLSALACSPDGKWLAIGKRDGSVAITDISGKSVKTLAVAGQRISDVQFSPDGSLLAARVSGAPAQLWNPAQGTLIAVLRTDFGGSEGMAFSPDSSLFATADSDTAVRIYDRSGKLKTTYSGFLLEPFTIGFLDNKQIVVGGADRMLTILDASDGHVVRQLAKQPDIIFGIAALAEGKYLCSLQIDAMRLTKITTSLWDMRSGAQKELAVDGSFLVGVGTTAGHKGILFTADSSSSLTAWEFAN
jgi:WD40 repeat protein